MRPGRLGSPPITTGLWAVALITAWLGVPRTAP
jgi:hypothetical protein